jgi:hypothetical protein
MNSTKYTFLFKFIYILFILKKCPLWIKILAPPLLTVEFSFQRERERERERERGLKT